MFFIADAKKTKKLQLLVVPGDPCGSVAALVKIKFDKEIKYKN
ncbi:MAG TPA: hypothetical protein VJ201_02435 [Candidatus Babeliales bacterium]|nr:hypothetical protein [Candidatus Babeliales bacterium]HLC07236.1 hypothetical protein [Candidatus Babeliales bacterium]